MKSYNKDYKVIKPTKEQLKVVKSIQDILTEHQIQIDITPTEIPFVDIAIAVFKNGDQIPIQKIEYKVHEDGYFHLEL